MATFKPYSQRITTLVPSCLGYRLLPFSLGQSLALKSSKSKFTSGEYNSLCDINYIAEALVNDHSLIPEFVFAVLVCSTTYDEFMSECGNGNIASSVEEVIKHIKDNKINLLFEIHTFAHYLKSGTDAPLYKVKEDDKDSVTTNPVEAEEAILSTLMSECGYTRDECLNLPLTETMSAYLLYAHKMGSIELESKEVFELKESLKEKGLI
jgi:hypothetical protein